MRMILSMPNLCAALPMSTLEVYLVQKTFDPKGGVESGMWRKGVRHVSGEYERDI